MQIEHNNIITPVLKGKNFDHSCFSHVFEFIFRTSTFGNIYVSHYYNSRLFLYSVYGSGVDLLNTFTRKKIQKIEL